MTLDRATAASLQALGRVHEGLVRAYELDSLAPDEPDMDDPEWDTWCDWADTHPEAQRIEAWENAGEPGDAA